MLISYSHQPKNAFENKIHQIYNDMGSSFNLFKKEETEFHYVTEKTLYSKLQSGLNYLVKCENTKCLGYSESVVVLSRGYGEFQPNKDVDFNEKTNLLVCPICNNKIKDQESIQAIILFNSKGKIFRRVNKRGTKLQEMKFSLRDNQLLIFGNKNTIDNHSTIKIIVQSNYQMQASISEVYSILLQKLQQPRNFDEFLFT